MPTANLVSGIILLAFSLLLAFVLIPMQIRAVPGAIISPRMLPNVCAAMLGILSVLLIAGALKERLQNRVTASPLLTRGELVAAGTVIGLTLAAIVVFRLLGAGVAGAFLVVTLLLAAGERNPLVLVGMPAALIGAAWLLFSVVLGTSIQ